MGGLRCLLLCVGCVVLGLRIGMGNKETKGEDILNSCGSIRSIFSLPLPEELVGGQFCSVRSGCGWCSEPCPRSRLR